MAKSCNTNDLSVGREFSSLGGLKSYRIQHSDGSDFTYTHNRQLRVPFGPSDVGSDPIALRRMYMEVECDQALEKIVSDVDAWAVEYFAAHSKSIFKLPLSPEQVKVFYTSCLKRHDKGTPTTLKCVIHLDGPKAVYCWSPQGTQLSIPDDWTQYNIKPKLHFACLLAKGSDMGMAVRFTDVELIPREDPQPRTSPFFTFTQ